MKYWIRLSNIKEGFFYLSGMQKYINVSMPINLPIMYVLKSKKPLIDNGSVEINPILSIG
jgi:hypothetical protein